MLIAFNIHKRREYFQGFEDKIYGMTDPEHVREDAEYMRLRYGYMRDQDVDIVH